MQYVSSQFGAVRCGFAVRLHEPVHVAVRFVRASHAERRHKTGSSHARRLYDWPIASKGTNLIGTDATAVAYIYRERDSHSGRKVMRGPLSVIIDI